MNRKGFVFVETLVTITILIVALVAIYVSYSAFIVSEKRRLYYDDMSYMMKTFAIRDTMYAEKVYYNDGGIAYYNVDALEKYAQTKGYYIIGQEQSMFLDYKTIGNTEAVNSTLFSKIMEDNNADYLIYISNFKNFKDKNNIDNLSEQKNMPYLKKYLTTINIPCETDSNCSSYYRGIIISVISEHKNGNKLEDDYNNFTECMKDKSKKTMECEEAHYMTWVYA